MSYAPLRQSIDEPGSSHNKFNIDTAIKSLSTRVTRSKKSKKHQHQQIPTLSSVFTPIPSDATYIPPELPPKSDYDNLVSNVKTAINEGLHPKMILKGSSGSYFARGKVNNEIEIVGVFKPKDEEPYGRLNPKWTKWAHRNFFWWIAFGRSCLIPNLSYISEAAASILDDRLQLGIVPRTGLVDLASPSFFYEWADRRAWHKGSKPLPDKIGSLQTFMHGYKDASNFLADHPFPGRTSADAFAASRKKRSNNFWRCQPLQLMCGTREGDNDDLFDYDVDADAEWQAHAQLDDDDGDFYSTRPPRSSHTDRPFSWTPELQQSFREELEKLVILDYLMRNTDRGLDNFMIQFDPGHTVNNNASKNGIINRPPTRNAEPFVPDVSSMSGPPTPLASNQPNGSYIPDEPNNPQESLFYDENQLDVKQSNLNIPRAPSPSPSQSRQSISENRPRIRIAAIDNSLSFPHQHPKGWRSYTYGWLFLPVSLIGQPFSASTRRHFLPLLSDPKWWTETTQALRQVFEVDPDFNEGMFARQMAIVKGQGWNIVQSLRHADEGPLELCRRVKVLVWDDVIDIADNNEGEVEEQDITERRYSYTEDEHEEDDEDEVKSLPGHRVSKSFDGARPSFDRAHSHNSPFSPPHSPPSSRVNSRPVPFSRQRSASIYAKSLDAASGVDVLQHMDQLDAVEHSMHQLANEQDQTQVNNVNAERDENDIEASQNAENWLKTYASGNDRSEQRPGRISTDTHASSVHQAHRMPPTPYKTRKVIVERLETVKGGNPYFETW
ncbi:hypothetical protein E3Q10_00874 [Wallemia mellicola]|uniref:Phosphatidylinositol 4-kinase n=3 Tax=Wallemia mellicola TaxID=1708541 RepID=A0A4T0R6P2_9BASI|nr:hypothetical protein E3Q17_03296 [Wallemia mellicola]TIC32934.1 hypothetical protein E3Q10_00874 [Wallemia mellicola]TIC72828.1 hypothetical protein E3Q00_03571 [Wallemia mellicola]